MMAVKRIATAGPGAVNLELTADEDALIRLGMALEPEMWVRVN